MPASPADEASADAPGGGTTEKPSDDKTLQANFRSDPNRKIIKNGDMTIEVDNATVGLNWVSAVAAQAGGYVLEIKNSDQAGAASSATMSFAVPVDTFEKAMSDLRAIGTVLNEQASGQDVSQEFVDVQSQIANLEATAARVRTFLEQAKTVEEALKVNAQLTELEGQISQLKGRINFLTQRAAYSTITVVLQQKVPSPTATLVPSPTPSPTAIPWQPGKTIDAASGTLQSVLQGIATAGIWLGIVGLPFFIVLALGYGLLRALRSRNRRPAPAPRTPPPSAGA